MDRKGKVIGMLVFILGIALTLLVFGMAFAMFTSKTASIVLSSDAGAVKLGNAVIQIILKIILLFIMTIAGSVIAGKGIQLYLGISSVKQKSEE
ncbi:MAG: hypothetical protein K6U80_01900 [Firmicutes bacterium]|nr:hypothetical protein [Bacillota bacterium]